MRISSFRLKNYKCFRDTGKISLSPGMNVILGRNDAGKSALVEAISFQAGSSPHRSLITLPTAHTPLDQTSIVSVTFETSSEDLRSCLNCQPDFTVPAPDRKGYEETAREFQEAVAKGGPFNTVWHNTNLVSADLESFGSSLTTVWRHFANTAYPMGLALADLGEIGGAIQDYGFRVAPQFRSRIYAFKAERLNVGDCGVAGSQELQSNASNLADVLNQLSSTNPSRYERLMCHIRTIFPHITQVTAAVMPNNMVRVAVWTVPVSTERAYLSIPLSASGTGIGQVLAMLYVVVTSDLPHVIAIDEPQSFLHPGAVRKLLEILRSYPQHQYIITTHSPVALPQNTTDAMFLIRRDETKQESLVERIDTRRTEDLRGFLAEVGARLSDVFGADSILWVEGKTEETCFPELIRQVANVPLQGAQLLGVISTDELAAKFANRVFDIYARLSGQTSLLPPAIAFIFDREGRSDIERADIDRKSGGLVRWLPRRMYENYLLEPEAIHAVLRSEDVHANECATLESVDRWMRDHGSDRRYFSAQQETEYRSPKWYIEVHGGKLLHDLFDHLTNARVEYDKVRHGLMLTQCLVQNPSTAIRDLAQTLAELVRASVTPP